MLLLGSIFYYQSAHACLNEMMEPEEDGKARVSYSESYGNHGDFIKVLNHDDTQLHKRRKFYEELGDNLTPGQKINYAVVLIRLGDPGTAKVMLVEMAQDSVLMSGDKDLYYPVAANLGTAYELLHTHDSALYWIRKAISINSQSHKGSEWIHMMLLRYEVAKEKNPAYLTEGGALNLDFGSLDLPVNTYNMDLNKMQDQLAYQLGERLYFIQAPDTLMGMLFFDFANIIALNQSLEASKFYYEEAKRFGMISQILDARLERIANAGAEELSKKASDLEGEALPEPPARLSVYAVATILAILAVLAVYFLLRRRKNS